MITVGARAAGRPAGTESTRAAILDAARDAFATTGFDGTSVRAVAAEAGVDPSTVLHFFGSKDGLFTAVIAAVTPAMDSLVDGVRTGVCGAELVRRYLAVWEGERSGPSMRSLVRAGLGSARAAQLLRATLLARIVQAAQGIAPIGVELVVTQLLGIGVGRYVIELDALAAADVEAIAIAVGPSIDRSLAMRTPTPSPSVL